MKKTAPVACLDAIARGDDQAERDHQPTHLIEREAVDAIAGKYPVDALSRVVMLHEQTLQVVRRRWDVPQSTRAGDYGFSRTIPSSAWDAESRPLHQACPACVLNASVVFGRATP